MRQMTLERYVLLLILALLLAACEGATTNATATTQPSATELSATFTRDAGAAGEERGQAYVENLQVVMLESFPVQVEATVTGNLSDSCTSLADTNVQREGNVFQIQLTTLYASEVACTEALVPFEVTVPLDVQSLPADTYTVIAGELTQQFTLSADNVIEPTRDLTGASLTLDTAAAAPGQTITLTGTGFPPDATIQIGIGPVASEFEIIEGTPTAQVGAGGQFTLEVMVPDYVQPGQEWVFVANLVPAGTGFVLADPLPIIANEGTVTPTATVQVGNDTGVNEPVNGEFTRTQIFLIALEDAGQSGTPIGCNDSVIPVIIDIAPTAAPLTAALEQLLSLTDEFYGQSGLYNALHQSDLTIEAIDIISGEAMIYLTGTLQLGGVCDNPRVQAQLEQTALQYDTIEAVSIFVNGEPLETLLSGQ